MIRWPVEWPVGVVLGVAAFLAVRGVDPLPVLLAAGLAGAIVSTPPVREAIRRALASRGSAAASPAQISFDDIGGQRTAKRELREALDFLRVPDAARALGVRPLRGVLLAGPPGTGKTMLAKAAATYTGSTFLAAAGSEFIEMYAGVGAQRVRDLFDRARRAAREAGRRSAVIFLDEMDVLGARRGGERGHMEYDQTLNQLLVEMDGMARDPAADVSLLVIGATNRADLLDDALVRPGRFDRVVHVDLPDRTARLDILRLHSQGRPFAADCDLDALAAETFGMSGAHLESVVNEASILALRAASPTIERHHLSEAVEKVIMGDRMDRVPSPEQRRRVAVHEGGHALVAEIVRPGSVAAITITSRGGALGYVRQTPGDDRYLSTGDDLCDDIAVALGGSVAEELVLGSRSTGAHDDFGKAGEAARRMVLSGMTPLGIVAEATLPSGDLHQAATAVLQAQAARVRQMVDRHRGALEALATRLLAEERLTGEDIRALAGLDRSAAS